MSKKSIIIDEKNVEIKKIVKLENEAWAKLLSEAEKELFKKVKVNGYRPGKVPAHIAKQHVSQASLFNHAIDSYFRANAKEIFEQLKKETERVIAASPAINILKLSDAEAEFEIIYPLATDVKTFKLDKIKAKFPQIKVTEADVEKLIEERLQQSALQLPLTKDQKTKFGDTVTLNYKGYVDGEAFEGGEAEKYDLKLGTKTFIDTFEDQLTNKKVGWKGTIKVTFPAEYAVDKLKGKLAEFEVEIVEAKRPEEVKLTEANLSSLHAGNAKTIAEAKEIYKHTILNNKLTEQLAKFLEDIAHQVMKNNDINVNRMFVQQQVEKRRATIVKQLKDQGIKLEEYLGLIGKSSEEFDQIIADEETKQMQYLLAAQSLVQDLNAKVEVMEEDFKAWKDMTSMQSGLSTTMIDTFFFTNEQNKENIKLQIEERKIQKLLASKWDSKAAKIIEKVEKELAKFAGKISESILEAEKKEAEKSAKKEEEKPKKKTNKKAVK
ncbi:trigger factor [Mycoplasmopsis opalescens]|uniref:trigger factor n=1 Tax=Mycoplasmopsis opalescens TaxID=114886 RepID=UPI0004A73991|nr:trigger factor [Mycoplasmopsis opalescens]